MSRDLDSTIEELGGDFRAVVERLRSAKTVEPSRTSPLRAPAVRMRTAWLTAAGAAAAVLAAAVVFRDSPPPFAESVRAVYAAAYSATEDSLETIVASQGSDGSWRNDFLTRQNAAALRGSGDRRMQVAYRRAVRYLRSKGLSPLSDCELESRRRRFRL